MKKVIIISCLLILFSVIGAAEKDRLAVMDVQDEDRIFNARTIVKATDYIFAKLQETNSFWMVPMSDRDTALEQAIETTVKGSRKECVDEKCQLSLVAQLQANFLINTKIKKLYEGTCNISISKFDVEKRAGVQSWVEKFNCTEKGLYGAIDGFRFGGKRRSGSFQSGKIGETVEEWDVGTGEETIVNFESHPAGAVVMVDGKIKCQKTPCSKMITQGKHEISMQLENYVEQTKGTDIKKGTKIRYTLEPDFGYLTVRGKHEVELKLDGEKIGKIPISKRVINPGAHQIEHTDECYYQSGEKFQIKRGDNKEINLELNPKESAIKVTARDDKGNDLEADVFVDGKKVGTAPGTFKIPLCSKEVAVKTKKGEFKQNLTLQEKEVSTVDAILKTSHGNWSKVAPNIMDWHEAKAYCENLNEDGYSDWRLPTISELRTLIQNCYRTETGGACEVGACEVTDNCLSWTKCRNSACNGCSSAHDGRYSKLGDTSWLWSSSGHSDNTDHAWYVYFRAGGVHGSSKYDGINVRCVRGKIKHTDEFLQKKVSISDADLKPSSGNIDADLKPSGENWSKKAPKEMEWDNAIRYCENLNEDGYSDWRLPTISELRTLIKTCPKTETGGACKVTDSCLSKNRCINDTCKGCSAASDGRYSKLGDTEWFWSSSGLSDITDYAWYVLFEYGGVDGIPKVSNISVRCVR